MVFLIFCIELSTDTRMVLDSSDSTAITSAVDTMEKELKDLRINYETITKKPKAIIEELQNLIDLCYTVAKAIQDTKTVYIEEELLSEVVEKFVIYGEPIRDSKGVYRTPQPSIVPVLKSEALLDSRMNVEVDITAEPFIFDMGIENKKITDEIFSVLEALEKEISTLKTQYL